MSDWQQIIKDQSIATLEKLADKFGRDVIDVHRRAVGAQRAAHVDPAVEVLGAEDVERHHLLLPSRGANAQTLAAAKTHRSPARIEPLVDERGKSPDPGDGHYVRDRPTRSLDS